MIKLEFEGTDGAGKTTALKYFIEQAKNRGLKVVETREVGNPHIPACVKMREFVLDPKSNLNGKSMEAIFAAMRFENDEWLEKLKASDDVPDLVVSDRGLFSHLAYTDHNVSKEFTDIFYMNSVVALTSLPDVVLYFSVDTDTALKRRVKRGEGMDVIEMKGVEYQEKVRESFDKYLTDAPDIDIYEVNANQNIEQVRTQMDFILDQLIQRKSAEKSGAW